MSIAKRHIALAVTGLANAAIIAATAPDYTQAGNLIFILLMAKAWIFVAYYAIRIDWKSATPAGRAVTGLVGCIALICTQGVLTITLGTDYAGRSVVRLILIAAVGMTLMNLLLNLIAAQRNGGDNP